MSPVIDWINSATSSSDAPICTGGTGAGGTDGAGGGGRYGLAVFRASSQSLSVPALPAAARTSFSSLEDNLSNLSLYILICCLYIV